MSQFPNASESDTFNSEELKRVFYTSMPLRWRTNFVNSGQNVQQVSLEALRTYMVQQEAQTDAHRKKTRDLNKKNQTKPSFHRNSRQSKFTKKSSNPKQDKDDKKQRKLSNDDDCPIHGNSHKWGQCHQNQYGENFRPRRTPSSNNTHSSNFSSRDISQRSNYYQGPPSQVQV